MNEKEYYSVKEIQEILGICRQTAYKYLDKKEFDWILLDCGYRISKKSFDEWRKKQCCVKTKPVDILKI